MFDFRPHYTIYRQSLSTTKIAPGLFSRMLSPCKGVTLYDRKLSTIFFGFRGVAIYGYLNHNAPQRRSSVCLYITTIPSALSRLSICQFQSPFAVRRTIYRVLGRNALYGQNTTPQRVFWKKSILTLTKRAFGKNLGRGVARPAPSLLFTPVVRPFYPNIRSVMGFCGVRVDDAHRMPV